MFDRWIMRWMSVVAMLIVSISTTSAVRAGDAPFDASENAVKLDGEIDWSLARLIAVQDAGRYKTLESFARESMSEMYGKEHLPGLSPIASVLEWLFNREAYEDTPVVRIKDRGVQIHLSTHFPEVIRLRIQSTGYMTPRELRDETVESRIRELEPLAPMINAMRRVRNAQFVAQGIDQLLKFVPSPKGLKENEWHFPNELAANLPAEARMKFQQSFPKRFVSAAPIEGMTESQALAVLGKWSAVEIGWKSGDAARVQASLDELAAFLPTLAAPGVYPSESQRSAEASYYAWGKFTWGYWIYALGAIVSIWALVTGWKVPRWIAMALLLIAMGLHAYGIGLRWYILGRIPVANMFEAVVGSAWGAILIGLLLELRYKSKVFLVGCNLTGFLALILGSYVIPGAGEITTIMGILDDVMLRIHTVLIILSYGLIFLGGTIALMYLFGYYFRQNAAQSAQVGLITSVAGTAIWTISSFLFQVSGADASGYNKNEMAATGFIWASCAAATLLIFTWLRSGVYLRALLINLFIVCLTLGVGNHLFTSVISQSLMGVGTAWLLANAVGGWRTMRRGGDLGQPALALAGGGAMAFEGPVRMEQTALRSQRPILAGGAPGDEGGALALPKWLNELDWCHLIILNIVFVMLFVGIILGAIWADYSWGRPWGWDPKEVFAMNTWIIYAILMHVRFFVKQRGLWTAWLSVAGCLMMAFNWCFVNFFIVGLHSYA